MCSKTVLNFKDQPKRTECTTLRLKFKKPNWSGDTVSRKTLNLFWMFDLQTFSQGKINTIAENVLPCMYYMFPIMLLFALVIVQITIHWNNVY